MSICIYNLISINKYLIPTCQQHLKMNKVRIAFFLTAVAIMTPSIKCQQDGDPENDDPNREVKDSIMNSFLESDLDNDGYIDALEIREQFKFDIK